MPRVEVRLLGQLQRLAAGPKTAVGHDQEAHGLLDKRPRTGVYPASSQPLTGLGRSLPRGSRYWAVRSTGGCFAQRNYTTRGVHARQETRAVRKAPQDIRGAQEEGNEQVARRTDQQRAGKKEQVTFPADHH